MRNKNRSLKAFAKALVAITLYTVAMVLAPISIWFYANGHLNEGTGIFGVGMLLGVIATALSNSTEGDK